MQHMRVPTIHRSDDTDHANLFSISHRDLRIGFKLLVSLNVY
jgi:hypothetical protein